jgi:hypothetical protein
MRPLVRGARVSFSLADLPAGHGLRGCWGRILVNGIELWTAGARRDVDGELSVSDGSADAPVPGIGMAVTFTGTLNDDGMTGTAETISYDDAVQALVQGSILDVEPPTRSFSVLGGKRRRLQGKHSADHCHFRYLADRFALLDVTTRYRDAEKKTLPESKVFCDAQALAEFLGQASGHDAPGTASRTGSNSRTELRRVSPRRVSGT